MFTSRTMFKPLLNRYFSHENLNRKLLTKLCYSSYLSNCRTFSLCNNFSYQKTSNNVYRSAINLSSNFKIENSINHKINKTLMTSSIDKKEYQSNFSQKNRSTLYYLVAIGVLVVGFSYAAVPLYRIFCQAYSYGGTVQHDQDGEKVVDMVPIKDRKISINFNADTAAAMVWNFKPQQSRIDLVPGETALAFYTAKNPTNRQIIGVSTYNVLPYEAGQYFNKIQCFCFEEQMLNPHEEVHMPVFFYIDPEFAEDPAMENVDTITLSYTFFEAKPGLEIPLPGFMKNKL